MGIINKDSSYSTDKEIVLEEYEMTLLKTIDSMANAMVEGLRDSNYDVLMTNALYSLREKLGIADILDD